MGRPTLQTNMVMIMLLTVLLLSFVHVNAVRRDKFFPHAEGISRKNNHSIEVIMNNYFCNSRLEISAEDEGILIQHRLNDEIDALSNVICREVSSSLKIKCMQMARRYLHQASLCLQMFLLGENACKDIELNPEIPSSFPLSASSENERSFVKESSHGILTEVLKGLLMFSFKHKEYKSCAPCRNAMENIHNAVGTTERQIMIIKILHEVCDVADTYSDQCKKMILMYGPFLLGNVQKMVTDNDLCYMTHMCKDPLPSPSPPTPPSPPNGKDVYSYI